MNLFQSPDLSTLENAERVTEFALVDQAIDAYWRNRVYNQPQIWLVPTTSDHLHFSQPIGHNTYL